MTRRHHPLEEQVLDVVKGGPVYVVVRLRDGTTMRLPRAWTDVDGVAASVSASIYCVDSLREFLELVEALRRRT